MEIPAIIGMFFTVQNANLQPDPSSETSVFTNIQLYLLMKISALIAIYTPAHDERQMQLRKIQSDDKTQFRVRLHHPANRYVLKREKLGPTPGFIQTGSENQRTTFHVRMLTLDIGSSNSVPRAMFLYVQSELRKRIHRGLRSVSSDDEWN